MPSLKLSPSSFKVADLAERSQMHTSLAATESSLLLDHCDCLRSLLDCQSWLVLVQKWIESNVVPVISTHGKNWWSTKPSLWLYILMKASTIMADPVGFSTDMMRTSGLRTVCGRENTLLNNNGVTFNYDEHPFYLGAVAWLCLESVWFKNIFH